MIAGLIVAALSFFWMVGPFYNSFIDRFVLILFIVSVGICIYTSSKEYKLNKNKLSLIIIILGTLGFLFIIYLAVFSAWFIASATP